MIGFYFFNIPNVVCKVIIFVIDDAIYWTKYRFEAKHDH
jgi:hypothetical protein